MKTRAWYQLYKQFILVFILTATCNVT